MKKLLTILILLISISSFGQKRQILRVPSPGRYVNYIMKNSAGDSIVYFINSKRYALKDKDSITAQITYTFSTGLTNAANTITNNLLTGISGGQTIIGSTSTNSGLTLKPTTSGTAGAGADIKFLVGNNGAIDAGMISYLGRWGINNTSPGGAGSASNFLNINTPTTTDALAEVMLGLNALGNKGLVIQAKASQTGNLFEAQNSGGTLMTNISATGNLGIGASNTGTNAIYVQRSDLTGGGAAAPAIRLDNTSSTSPGGGQYNYALMTLGAGNAAILSQIISNYGTGAAAPFNLGTSLIFRTVGAFPIAFAPNSVNVWQFNSSGHFLAVTDNTYDIGASGATRPRTVYVGTNGVFGGKIFAGGTTTPTALVHMAAGTASANTAPLKFTSGTLLTTAEAGAVEFLTDGYYVTTTTGAKRRFVVAGTSGRATAQTAANASVATYTLGASDASYEVSANVLVTTSSAEAFTVTCAYTDEGNTARTQTMPFVLLAGTTAAAINFSQGAVPYEGIPIHLRVKASTTITIATTGTFTGCTYNVESVIKQTQ